MEHAEVYVMPAGPGRFTGPSGSFTFTGIPVGDHRVILRRIGYRPELTDVSVTEGTAVDVDVTLYRMPVLLAARLVSVQRERLPRVYERMEKQIGVTMFADELERYQSSDIDDVFERFSPKLRSVLQAPPGCPAAAYYVDGVHKPPSGWEAGSIRNFVSITDIAVVEAFRSPDFVNEPFLGDDKALSGGFKPRQATLPTAGQLRGGAALAGGKRSGASCQRVVLIWTKYFVSRQPRSIEK